MSEQLLDLIKTAPSTTGSAGLNLGVGVTPSSPNNGDLWNTTTGMFIRTNGATLQLGVASSPADLSLLERMSAVLPVTSVTRDATTTRVTQVVRSGTVSGVSITVTKTYNRDATTQLVTSVVTLHQGGGANLTVTETMTRDANGRVTSIAVT